MVEPKSPKPRRSFFLIPSCGHIHATHIKTISISTNSVRTEEGRCCSLSVLPLRLAEARSSSNPTRASAKPRARCFFLTAEGLCDASFSLCMSRSCIRAKPDRRWSDISVVGGAGWLFSWAPLGEPLGDMDSFISSVLGNSSELDGTFGTLLSRSSSVQKVSRRHGELGAGQSEGNAQCIGEKRQTLAASDRLLSNH